MSIRIGCGSWSDSAYAGILFPPGFPPDMRLSGYAMWFDHVEVNATYYAIPKKEVVEKWISSTPSNFLFDIRLPRAISQSPHKSAKEGRLLDYLLEAIQPLLQTERFGTFLLVLPPSFSPERHQLDELDVLIEKLRPHSLAVELRHSAWVDDENRATTLSAFRERRITWVATDMPQITGSDIMPPIDEVTDTRLTYLRLHGRNPNYLEAESAAERHTYAYTEDDLHEIVKRIRYLAEKAEHLRVVANNHASDFAPRAALWLQQFFNLEKI